MDLLLLGSSIKQDVPNLLNQLVFRKRRLEEFHLVALLLQNIAASLVDILQKQDLDVLGGKGLQVLRIDQRNRPRQGRAVAGGRVEGGRGGGREVLGLSSQVVRARTNISCRRHVVGVEG